MRKKLVITLVALNVFLGLALLARATDSQIIPLALFPCCQGQAENAYCCQACCWFYPNCDEDSDCRETVTSTGG